MQPQDEISRHLSMPQMPGQVAAVVLAAGLSRRMGRPKPLLDLGGAPVLARVVGLFQAAGVGQVVVVTGHQARELTPLIAGLGAQAVFNPLYEQDMFGSLRVGAQALAPGTTAFFLLPADMPVIRPATLLRLAGAWRESGARAVHPCFLGRRGHPPLLDAGLIAGLLAWPGQGGLKGFLASQSQQGHDLEVPDQGVLWDMDHPQDYQQMSARWQGRGLPTPGEVEALLGPVLEVGPAVRAHGRAVAKVALALGRAEGQAGQEVDLACLEAAALLHDLAKGRPNHAQTGADLLRRWGWPSVALAVQSHMDIEVPSQGEVSAAELLYLADKLVEGERLVGLSERFKAKLARYGADPRKQEAIERRWHNALAIQARLEQACGRSLVEILANL